MDSLVRHWTGLNLKAPSTTPPQISYLDGSSRDRKAYVGSFGVPRRGRSAKGGQGPRASPWAAASGGCAWLTCKNKRGGWCEERRHRTSMKTEHRTVCIWAIVGVRGLSPPQTSSKPSRWSSFGDQTSSESVAKSRTCILHAAGVLGSTPTCQEKHPPHPTVLGRHIMCKSI